MKHGNFTSLVIIIQHSLIRSTNLIFENEIFLILLIQNLLLIHKILSSFFFLDSKLRKGINLGRNVTRYVTRLRYKHWQSASLEMITRMSLSLSLSYFVAVTERSIIQVNGQGANTWKTPKAEKE